MPNPISEINLLSPESLVNPYPMYGKMQVEAPFYWFEPAQSWMVSRYTDVKQLCSDFNALGMENLKPVATSYSHEEHRLKVEDINNFYRDWLLMQNPPDHTRLRNLMNKAFKPSIIRNLRADIQQITDELLEAMAGRQDIAFLEEFAHKLPILVIALMLGVPREDTPQLLKWGVRTLVFIADQTTVYTDLTEEMYQLLKEMRAYFQTCIDERRSQPRDDLMSVLIQAELDGERMSDAELISNFQMMLVAGYENTQNTIANGLLALLQNPEQIALLRSDPNLLPSAIEEMLRYCVSARMSMRNIGTDMVVGGKELKQGERVFLLFAAANRDPSQFQNPQKFDITRNPNPHVGFGYSIHFCLGAPLARLEMEVAFSTLLKRWRNIELVLDEPEWMPSLMYQFQTRFPLKVEWAD